MKRRTLLLLSVLLLVFSFLQFAVLAEANPMSGVSPAPIMPTVTIEEDGSINPANVPIKKEGKIYTLTDDVTNYDLIIKCNDITLDGAGFKIQEVSTIHYAPHVE